MGRELLKDQVALITGAGQGIGRAIALEYAAEGAHVALFDQSGETLSHVAAEMGDAPKLPVVVDITDYTALRHAFDQVIGWYGRLDVLVNNAGIFRTGTILEDTIEDWRLVMGVNLEALYVLTKMAAQHMAGRRNGRIINIGSVAGWFAQGNVGSYNASKGGVLNFTKSLAVELGSYNITVNAIAPGFIRTAQLEDAQGHDLTAAPDFQAWYIERKRIPLLRPGEPEDVAGAAVFLASDYCRYISGHVLVVDGGMTSTF